MSFQTCLFERADASAAGVSYSCSVADTREAAVARRARERYLMDRPQALWILPTMWFWNDPANWRRVRALVAVATVLVSLGVGALQLGWLVGGLLGGGSVFLILGLVERYIRRQALVRRRELTRGEASRSLGDGR